jgi:hypothetical protein
MGSVDEANEIPGNLYVTDKFVSGLDLNGSIAFIGAGVSIELYKSWSELLKFLGLEATKRGMATDDDMEFWTIQEIMRPQQVARMIRKKFGEEAEFYQILGQYFSAKKYSTTNANYTQLYKLIAQLPFRAIVTINYDPGIWNALLAHRKEACATPLATWNDKDLWEQKSLVIIGYGFSDTWLDRNLDDVLARNPEYKHSRHIAVVGLKREDEKHVTRYREMMLNLYRVNVLFYRVAVAKNGAEDHTDLIRILERVNQIVIRGKNGFTKEVTEVPRAEEYLSKKEEILPALPTMNRNFE